MRLFTSLLIFSLLSPYLLAASTVHAGEVTLGTDAQRAAGKENYQKYCAQCHGTEGDGDGIATPFFDPPPRDFTSATYKIRSTESGELPTDADLKNIILEGMPYTGMPGWPQFDDEELMELVFYIKTFAEDFADPDAIMAALEIPEAPPFSLESAESGKSVYEENKCMECHGLYGRSDGEKATTLTTDEGDAIRPADLTKRWTFRGGSTREDIYRTFTTGMDGTPMPSYADFIEEEARWQLVDYVYSLSRETANYSDIVFARAVEEEIDIESPGLVALFGDDAAFLPVVGQVIEAEREFFPSANAIKVRAIYNDNSVAVLLNWNDMAVENSGTASPIKSDIQTTSDAVAVQLPSEPSHGQTRPYFLYGDAQNSVNLWFADLATDLSNDGARLFIGKGSRNVQAVEGSEGVIEAVSSFADGEWTVIFKSDRGSNNGLVIEEGQFVPIAFSIWDGFHHEQGNRRGITSWVNMYIAPREAQSFIGPMLKAGLLVLLIEVLLIAWVRRKYKRRRFGELNFR
jgi:DMSO reductase family type II enzyme heme b subunit